MARDITLLHPELQAIIPKFLKACKDKGLNVKITDTLRTKEEQNKLYAQGRTTPGKVVTWVDYPYSNHNWGTAFDICRNDGKGAYNDSDNWFAKVGQVGKSFGLEWGGDWKQKDKPHFELTTFGTTNQLVKKYGTFDNFKKTWKTGVQYMKVTRPYIFNGIKKELEVINDNGNNYIKVKDIANLLNLVAEYDANTKATVLKNK